jgi:cobalt-zinc-cadmium efflux system outer membrane protein
MRVDPADGTRVAAFVLAIVACGCASAHRAPDVDSIGDRIRERTGAQPGNTVLSPPAVPPGVTLEDGLTQDEAVAVALWNNAEFQVSLTDLGFARADLVEAGLLRNPVLSLLFPVGPKQLEATLKWPIEVLWERPRRVAAARVAVDAVAERLVQAGLDLAASVKIGYADLALAEDRERLAEEAAKVQQRVHELTQARLKAGDISQMEARAAEIDAARAQEEARRASESRRCSRAPARRSWSASTAPIGMSSTPRRRKSATQSAASTASPT